MLFIFMLTNVCRSSGKDVSKNIYNTYMKSCNSISYTKREQQ